MPSATRASRPRGLSGGLLRGHPELYVGSRNCQKLVQGMHKQVDVVREIVGPETPVHGTLCFIEADWGGGLLQKDFSVNGVLVTYRRRLRPRLEEDGPLDEQTIARLAGELASALPAHNAP